MSKEECNTMVRTKKCGNNRMICEERHKTSDLNCIYNPTLDEKYAWLSSSYDEGIMCQIRAIPIAEHGSQSQVKLFDKCELKDNYCQISDAVVVWDNGLYENCPYQFDSTTHLIGWQRVGPDLIQHKEEGYFYKITEKLNNIKNCNGASLYKTAEGIYLCDDANTPKFLNAGVSRIIEPIHNMGLYNHMLLSEIDGIKFKEFQSQTNAKTRMCENLVTTLRTLKERERHFGTIIDPLLNITTVIYADKGVIWLPKCIVLNNFTLDSERDEKCYNDLKVKVTIPYSNKTVGDIAAFLNKAHVVTLYSKERRCNESIIRVIEEAKETYSLLIELKNKISYKKIPLTARLYPIENEIFKYNFPHYKELLTDIDLANIIISKRASRETLLSKDDSKSLSRTQNSTISKFFNDISTELGEKANSLSNFATSVFSKFYKTVVLLLICIIIIFAVVISVWIYRKLITKKKLKNVKNEINNFEEIEMKKLERDVREELRELIKSNEKSEINSPVFIKKNKTLQSKVRRTDI